MKQEQDDMQLTDKDRFILDGKDEDYTPHSWENLQQLIGDNQLEQLTRYPSQLRLYHERIAEIRKEHGSVINFVMKHRLNWEPSPEDCAPGSIFKVADARPLVDPRDYKILLNDWPYGLDKGITHVVVWMKHKLESDSERGDLTDESREMLEGFVNTRFRIKVGAENVLWFRNWGSIKSVKELEHFHVMIRNADGKIEQILSG